MVARPDVRFNRPIQRILAMVLFLGVVASVVSYLSVEIRSVFETNVELNGLIAFVFVVGVFVAFWQVFALFSAVNWLEALAARAKGIEAIAPPSLLVAMDPLRKGGAAQGIAATSARSMLDSVATRIDERRDTLRYISGLLIFLGLLGTFWGLAKTVPAVVDTIRAIAPQQGETGVSVFERLMTGLESQLGGMGVAFASSLLGLAGSLVVGFLELMSAGAQNRFYGELEAWLSTKTRLGAVDTEGGRGGGDMMAGDMVEQLALSSRQIEALNRIVAEGENRRAEDSAKIADAMRGIERIASQAISEREAIIEALAQQTRALERLAGAGGGEAFSSSGGEGLDVETRRHIRNMDMLMARLIEENAAGRLETAEALRREVRAVSRAVSDLSQALSAPAR